jgi:hypothetical protein
MRLIDAHDIEYEHICGEFRVSEEKINAMPTIFEISDNATNGDVIQALFKPTHIEKTDDNVIVENYDFNKKWWNSPY